MRAKPVWDDGLNGFVAQSRRRAKRDWFPNGQYALDACIRSANEYLEGDLPCLSATRWIHPMPLRYSMYWKGAGLRRFPK